MPYGRCAGDGCNRALLAAAQTLCGACIRQADEQRETNGPFAPVADSISMNDWVAQQGSGVRFE